MKLTIEVNPTIFLIIEILIKYDIIETFVVVRKSKIPNYLSSEVPKKYEWNGILGDLHRVHKISSNFELEKQLIKKEYLSVNFWYNFIQSTFNSCLQKMRIFNSKVANWKKIEKHLTLDYLFANQTNIIRWSLSENWKALQKKNTPLL